MKFLIDECLHVSLVHVGQSRGHHVAHVNWLGLAGTPDWKLIPRIIDEDFAFLTNNTRDFRKLYAAQPVHAGLILMVRQVSPGEQRELFDAALDRLEVQAELISEAVEIGFGADGIIYRRYPFPGADSG